MKFTRLLRLLVTTLIILTLFISGVAASELEDTEIFLAMEIKALSQSIDKLVKTMENEAGGNSNESELRKMEIAIAYLNFRSRRIEMFERDLQNTRGQRNHVEDFLVQIEREEEALADAFNNNQQDTLQRARSEISSRKQSLKDRISRLDEEIILLENRIMDMRSQIDSVESFVEKNLVF
jgi:predicted  nucleic acid-binding Zn-ribbon protein